jgi:hypothetical protein
MGPSPGPLETAPSSAPFFVLPDLRDVKEDDQPDVETVMTVVPFPSTVTPEVAKAIADKHVDERSKELLRTLADGDSDDVRANALTTLMEHVSALASEDGDDDADAADDEGWRLIPALVSVAGTRDGAERAALLVCAGHLQVGRLVDLEDDPSALKAHESFVEAASARALKLAGEAVSTTIADVEVLRPLMVVLAAFHGHIDLAITLLSDDAVPDDDDDLDDDVDDDEEDVEDDD